MRERESIYWPLFFGVEAAISHLKERAEVTLIFLHAARRLRMTV
jgi:hypothetical protein